MSRSVLQVEYGYSSGHEAELDRALSALQKEVGGQRRPWGMRGRAIDLLTFLELVLTFVAGATLGETLKSYFAGLAGTEKAKKLGERHHAVILQWLGKVRDSLGCLVTSVRRRFREGLVAAHSQGKEQAIAIRLVLGPIECFVVLNGCYVSDDALDRLPDNVIRMLQFIAEVGLPEESTVLQLCLDPASHEWRYLLVPSSQAFGRFVDRVIDLSTGELVTLRSAQEFIELLGVSESDGFKFLVAPYRHSEVK